MEASLDALADPTVLSEATQASQSVKLARIQLKRTKLQLNHNMGIEQRRAQQESDRFAIEHEKIASNEQIAMARLREASVAWQWMETT